MKGIGICIDISGYMTIHVPKVIMIVHRYEDGLEGGKWDFRINY